MQNFRYDGNVNVRALSNNVKITLASQLKWRQKIKKEELLSFNPPNAYIESKLNEFCIHFIHIGKCAGTSIIQALKRDINCNNIFEYHTFDANECLRYSIKTHSSSNYEKQFFVIAIRDPIARWNSAYNWDLHNMVLKNNISIENSVFSKFPNINMLARGILNDNLEAKKFGKYGHMGLGHSFYITVDLIKIIPKKITPMMKVSK